ncbi:MAG: hypothetical protein AAFW74_05950, partial [Pseudomonadota bacterium]
MIEIVTGISRDTVPPLADNGKTSGAQIALPTARSMLFSAHQTFPVCKAIWAPDVLPLSKRWNS